MVVRYITKFILIIFLFSCDNILQDDYYEPPNSLDIYDIWKQNNQTERDSNGYLPAPPHDESGHTWHHSDQYLFLMTKYGIEEMLWRLYLHLKS